jgi:hypothetical protein
MRSLLAALTLPLLMLAPGCTSSDPATDHGPGEAGQRPEASASSDGGAGTEAAQAAWWEEEPGAGEGPAAADSPADPPDESPPESALETPPKTAADSPEDEPAEAAGGQVVQIGSGHTLTAPESWDRKPPRSGFVNAEFAVPAVEGDAHGGRVTVTTAGGSIQANIQRWYGQFTQPDGSDTKDHAEVEEKTIAGSTVHLVDISGTYLDSTGGPFAGTTTPRPDYRMLAAIIETDEANYFVKFYGPAKTVAENEDEFLEMIEGVE